MSRSSARASAASADTSCLAELRTLLRTQKIRRLGDRSAARLDGDGRLGQRASRVLNENSRGLACRDMAKRNHLAARYDGGQHAFARAAEQDQHHVRRRLLKRFEKRVGSRRPQQEFDAVDDIDLALRLDRRKRAYRRRRRVSARPRSPARPRARDSARRDGACAHDVPTRLRRAAIAIGARIALTQG